MRNSVANIFEADESVDLYQLLLVFKTPMFSKCLPPTEGLQIVCFSENLGILLNEQKIHVDFSMPL